MENACPKFEPSSWKLASRSKPLFRPDNETVEKWLAAYHARVMQDMIFLLRTDLHPLLAIPQAMTTSVLKNPKSRHPHPDSRNWKRRNLILGTGSSRKTLAITTARPPLGTDPFRDSGQRVVTGCFRLRHDLPWLCRGPVLVQRIPPVVSIVSKARGITRMCLASTGVIGPGYVGSDCL